MLSRNILIFSAVVFLATTVSTAPVEEKEPDETETEVEDGEEELSEEEDDDDDSKIQEMNMGAGAQKATTAPKDTGPLSQQEASFEGDLSNGHKVNGGSPTHTGHASASSSTAAMGGTGGSHGGEPHAQASDSSSHDPSAGIPITSSVGTGFPAGAGDHGSSLTPVHSPGAVDAPSETISHDSGSQMGSSEGIVPEVHPELSVSDHHQSTSQMDLAGHPGVPDLGSQTDVPEGTVSEAPETEYNGNGQKLLMGGAHEGPAGTDHVADGITQTDSAGLVDHSIMDSHTEMMGFTDLFHPDFHMEGPDQTGTSSMTASTDPGSDPSLSSSSGSHPDAPGGLSGSSTSTQGGASSSGFNVQSDTQTDSTVPADPSGFGHPILDTTSGGDISTFGDHSHTPGDTAGAGPFDVHTSFFSDTTDVAVLSDIISHTDHSPIDYPEGAADTFSTDSADTNGNGRQAPVTEIHQTGSQQTDLHHDVTSSSDQQVITETQALADHHGVDSQLDSTAVTGGVIAHTAIPQTDVMGEGSLHGSGPHTDITGLGVEPVTSSHLQADTTAAGEIVNTDSLDTAGHGELSVTSENTNTTELLLGAGVDVGSTDMVGLQGSHIQTEAPVTGDTLNTMSQTDGINTVTADPQGIHEGLSQSGMTSQAQPAASAAEQYITSGQGPEGAENVELEDSC